MLQQIWTSDRGHYWSNWSSIEDFVSTLEVLSVESQISTVLYWLLVVIGSSTRNPVYRATIAVRLEKRYETLGMGSIDRCERLLDLIWRIERQNTDPWDIESIMKTQNLDISFVWSLLTKSNAYCNTNAYCNNFDNYQHINTRFELTNDDGMPRTESICSFDGVKHLRSVLIEPTATLESVVAIHHRWLPVVYFLKSNM